MIPRLPTQTSHHPLTVEAVRSGLKTERFGRTLHLYDRIESTNTTALGLAEQGAPEGTVTLADSQTQGRGRMGRHWISPPNVNLYLSIILRPDGDPKRVGLWSLAAAVAVARTIEQTTALPARLKWPNDILVHAKKISGLLLESAIQSGRVKHLVLGIGLNVNITREVLPESLRASVTSLREELGRELDRIGLLQRLLEQLELQYRFFQIEPPHKVMEAYAALSETLGQTVTVQLPDQEWTGNVIGLTPEGALILEKPDRQSMIVHSDDVIHVRTANAARD
ncbi:MAG: biotin--[acetyl-CoA-carboxylase] ligase [Nitrospirae bacterium]|nr:biotin--[acetyl-CoA-carboxylase] ligase [Nitrospirota bacterium]